MTGWGAKRKENTQINEGVKRKDMHKTIRKKRNQTRSSGDPGINSRTFTYKVEGLRRYHIFRVGIGLLKGRFKDISRPPFPSERDARPNIVWCGLKVGEVLTDGL